MEEIELQIPYCKSKYFQIGRKIVLRNEGYEDEVRNQCWYCDKYWDLSKPISYEVGQKHYYTCKYCNSVNHL